MHYTVFREVSHARHRLVVVHGWQSDAALQALREARRSDFRAALRAIGGNVIQFTGRERASTDML